MLESRQATQALPATAVHFGTEGAYVYVIEAGNKVQITSVSIGIDDGVWLEISAGLSGHERIVNGVIGRLSNGEIVNVMEE